MRSPDYGLVSAKIGEVVDNELFASAEPEVYMQAAILAQKMVSRSGLPIPIEERWELHQNAAYRLANLRARLSKDEVRVVMGIFPRAIATEESVLGGSFPDQFDLSLSEEFPFPGEEYPIAGIKVADLVIGRGPSDLAVRMGATFDITKDHAGGIDGRTDPEGHESYDLANGIYTFRFRGRRGAYQFTIGKDGEVTEVMIPEPVSGLRIGDGRTA